MSITDLPSFFAPSPVVDRIEKQPSIMKARDAIVTVNSTNIKCHINFISLLCFLFSQIMEEKKTKQEKDYLNQAVPWGDATMIK